MKVKHFILGIGGIVILVIISSFWRQEKNASFQSKSFPSDYVYTYTNDIVGEDQNVKNNIDFLIYESSVDTALSDISTIESAYISDEENQLDIDIISIEQDTSPIYVHDSEVYKKTVTFEFDIVGNVLLKDAKLYINMNSNPEPFVYDFGNLSFEYFTEDDMKEDDMIISAVAPVSTRIKDIPYTVGFLCEIQAKKELTISDFTFNLPDYSIDSANVRTLDMTYNEAMTLEEEFQLDTIVKEIYDVKTNTSTTQKANCKLKQGLNTVLIPFIVTEESKFLYSSGGFLCYTVDGEAKRIVVQSSERIQLARLTKNALEEVVFHE